jgi:hypothetical protein
MSAIKIVDSAFLGFLFLKWESCLVNLSMKRQMSTGLQTLMLFTLTVSHLLYRQLGHIALTFVYHV